jgi:hypothetical protein
MKKEYQMVTENKTLNEINHFIRQNTSEYYTMQVVQFFAKHPYARFNEVAIIKALNQEDSRYLIEETLKDLVSMGVIKVGIDGNRAVFSLSENGRDAASEYAKLDIYQQQRLLKLDLTKKRENVFQRMPEPALSAVA